MRKKYIPIVAAIIGGIPVIIAAFIGDTKIGSSNTMSVTIDRFNGIIVNGDTNTISNDDNYNAYLDEIVDEINSAQATTKDLTDRINMLNQQIKDQEKRINDLSEKSESLSKNQGGDQNKVGVASVEFD